MFKRILPTLKFSYLDFFHSTNISHIAVKVFAGTKSDAQVDMLHTLVKEKDIAGEVILTASVFEVSRG